MMRPTPYSFRRIINTSALAAVVTLMLTGCAVSPNPRYFTLSAVNYGESFAHQDFYPVNVLLGPITIPAVLDQTKIVTRISASQLHMDEFYRWGGDLQDDLQRVLAENIADRVPCEQVSLFNEIAAEPGDMQVLIKLQEFSGELGGIVTLKADWSIINRGKNKSRVYKKTLLREQTMGTGYTDYIFALNSLLAGFSAEIADAVREQLEQ